MEGKRDVAMQLVKEITNRADHHRQNLSSSVELKKHVRCTLQSTD